MFPNYIWDIKTDDKTLYLTFDDGPTPHVTNWVLTTLRSFNAKATFFCIGKNVEKNPGLLNLILSEGHAVGNHTQNHLNGWKTKTEDYLENIAQCEAVFKSEIKNSNKTKNQKPLSVNLFRPPYGKITKRQSKALIALGYNIIMWDVISFDWDKKLAKENCLINVTRKAKNGSIVVFHDSVKASKNLQYALPKVLEYFGKKGYSFKALQF
ncbi:MAG: polysaccharide deacetylase family protein [Flavobacteriaceae bacterium]